MKQPFPVIKSARKELYAIWSPVNQAWLILLDPRGRLDSAIVLGIKNTRDEAIQTMKEITP